MNCTKMLRLIPESLVVSDQSGPSHEKMVGVVADWSDVYGNLRHDTGVLVTPGGDPAHVQGHLGHHGVRGQEERGHDQGALCTVIRSAAGNFDDLLK